MKIRRLENKLRKEISQSIDCSEFHSSIVIEGEVNSWSEVIKAGKLAAELPYKGVVNELRVKGLNIPPIHKPATEDKMLDGKKMDVLIIGGGIIGSAIARELSKWNCSILLVEKEDDLAMHASSRNDGMIHPGFAPKPGSRKAWFNIRGNAMYSRISEELDISFNRKGSLIVFDNKVISLLKPLFIRRANINRVPGIKYCKSEELRKIEPHLSDEMVCGFYLPNAGNVSPYLTTIAYAENAVMNGVSISFNTIVRGIEKIGDKIIAVNTNRGKIIPKVVINAAGNFSDEVAAMANDQFFTIHPRKGEILMLDKKKGHLLNSIVAHPSQLIGSATKGGGLVKTVEGNILVGPNAYEQPFKEDYSTEAEYIESIMKQQFQLIRGIDKNDVITYFAGTRACTYKEDFIVEKSEYIDNLIHAAGIQSPGLAAAPAIAIEIERLTVEVLGRIMDLKKKDNWNPIRKGIPKLAQMTVAERNSFIKKNPAYGEIICRCEEVSKGEILDAIHSPIPAKTLDGIKRRVRPGMGRCQGGFCAPLVVDILQEELYDDALNVTKKGHGSNVLMGKTKD